MDVKVWGWGTLSDWILEILDSESSWVGKIQRGSVFLEFMFYLLDRLLCLTHSMGLVSIINYLHY